VENENVKKGYVVFVSIIFVVSKDFSRQIFVVKIFFVVYTKKSAGSQPAELDVIRGN
jgi:hypothetical protein